MWRAGDPGVKLYSCVGLIRSDYPNMSLGGQNREGDMWEIMKILGKVQ